MIQPHRGYLRISGSHDPRLLTKQRTLSVQRVRLLKQGRKGNLESVFKPFLKYHMVVIVSIARLRTNRSHFQYRTERKCKQLQNISCVGQSHGGTHGPGH